MPRDEVNQKYLWHLRLSHIGEDRINRLEKIELLDPLTFELYPICELCFQEKMIKLSFIGHRERTTEIFALVYSDMCDPFDVLARRGYSYS